MSFWDHWFGRPYDNLHRIVGADSLDGTTVIYFDQAESLVVEAPRGWSLANGRLLIREAARVRFQWFYYGRLPSHETLMFREYRWVDDHLTFATDFQPGSPPELNRNAPAVQLHTLS